MRKEEKSVDQKARPAHDRLASPSRVQQIESPASSMANQPEREDSPKVSVRERGGGLDHHLDVENVASVD